MNDQSPPLSHDQFYMNILCTESTISLERSRSRECVRNMLLKRIVESWSTRVNQISSRKSMLQKVGGCELLCRRRERQGEERGEFLRASPFQAEDQNLSDFYDAPVF